MSSVRLLGVSLCILSGLATACVGPTHFEGAAHFPGGAPACAARCTRDSLEMSGFVYSGEFASSCVCRPRSGAPGATPSAPADRLRQVADADVSAAVGTVTAMRARAQQQEDQDRQRRQRQQQTPAVPIRR